MNTIIEAAKSWKTILALTLIYVSIYFDWMWVWGAIFIFWCYRSISKGETYLVEDIKKIEKPVLFWAIIATWIVLSLYMIVFDLSRLVWSY